MTAPSDLLQAGVEALKQQRFPEAIQSLETFCDSQPSAHTKDYLQAQMWLVKAYQGNGQLPEAIALCQQMLTSDHPKVQAWVQRVLPTLEASQATATANPAATVAQPTAPQALLSPEQAAALYKAGGAALKLKQFDKAIAALEDYCQGADPTMGDYAQAQMWLVKAYQSNDQQEAAIALCEKLLNHERDYVKAWAQQMHVRLAPPAPQPETSTDLPPASSQSGQHRSAQPASGRHGSFVEAGTQSPPPPPKAGRSDRPGVKLAMRGVAANLSLASGVTISLLFGMILVLSLSLLLITDSVNPGQGLAIAIGITILFNALVFFLSPIIMDFVQSWLYGTRWIDIREIERQNPETAKVIRTVCQQKNLPLPRLGMIEDNNPTAFTYGSLPNTARLVVSRGLFTYLDDDEIATVYAHELGHIVHWDFAVMTLASTLVQIAYLIYTYIDEVANNLGDSDVAKKIKGGARTTALMAYVFYIVGEYLLLYLSRTREYYADHFAAEVTGNPNGLSRALVKIAYGILEEGKRSQEPSKMLVGTRALGIADAKSAAFTGTAYRVAAEPAKVGRVFLWDMFNPWAWWMELNSTHPLTGKRVRALSTYAEQLGLDTEFDMSQVIREGRNLNKRKLYGNFALDVVMFWADWLGLGLGLLLGLLIVIVRLRSPSMLGATIAAEPMILRSLIGMAFSTIISLILIGFGAGTLLKMVFMYPDFKQAPATDVLTLMSDPYASPLRGRAIKLSGEVIGRGDAGYRFGSDLKMQDPTGMIFLRYSSRFGPLGNWLFGMNQAESFIRQEVSVTGWFRRGIMPWVDYVRMDCDRKWTVHSYHRFWMLAAGLGSLALGLALPALLK